MTRVFRVLRILLPGLAVVSCVQGDAVGPEALVGGPWSISAQIDGGGADFGFLPIHRIRVTVVDAESLAEIGSEEFDVDPAVSEWALHVSIGGEAASIILEIEALNVASSGEISVEFSGRAGPISLTADLGTLLAVDVTVFPGPLSNLDVSSVSIDSHANDVREGSALQLSAVATSAGLDPVKLFWASLTPSVGTVDRDGLVTNLAPGEAQVVVAAGQARDTTSVRIVARPDAVVISPRDVTATDLGLETQFTAVVLDPRGGALPGFQLSWATSDSAIVRHLGSGLFRADAAGVTQVSVGVVGEPQLGDTTTFTVALPSVAEVLVTPATLTLDVGQTAQLSAETRDAGGGVLTGRQVTWTSGNGVVASVDGGGGVTALSAGTSAITASSEGVDGTAVVTVNQPSFDLVCGSFVQGSIGTVGQVDVDSIAGIAGQILSVMLVNTGGFSPGVTPRATVRDPGGSTVLTVSTNQRLHLPLAVSGTHSVSVAASDGAGLGTYNLNIECLGPTSGADGALTIGTPSAGALAASGEVDLYTFSGTSGGFIALTAIQTGGFDAFTRPRMSLFDAAGTYLGEVQGNGRVYFTLPATGTYTVMVDANDLLRVGTYEVLVQGVVPANPLTSTLTRGVATRGAIAGAGEVLVYGFAASVGEQFTVSVSDVSFAPGNAAVRVYAPSATFIGTTANGNVQFTATEAGTYIVVVGADDLVTTGSYDVTVSSP